MAAASPIPAQTNDIMVEVARAIVCSCSVFTWYGMARSHLSKASGDYKGLDRHMKSALDWLSGSKSGLCFLVSDTSANKTKACLNNGLLCRCLFLLVNVVDETIHQRFAETACMPKWSVFTQQLQTTCVDLVHLAKMALRGHSLDHELSMLYACMMPTCFCD